MDVCIDTHCPYSLLYTEFRQAFDQIDHQFSIYLFKSTTITPQKKSTKLILLRSCVL